MYVCTYTIYIHIFLQWQITGRDYRYPVVIGHRGVRCVPLLALSAFKLKGNGENDVETQASEIKNNNNNSSSQQQQRQHIIKHVNVTNSKAIRSCYIGRRQRQRLTTATANCDEVSEHCLATTRLSQHIHLYAYIRTYAYTHIHVHL